MRHCLRILVLLLLPAHASVSADEVSAPTGPREFKYRVTGLFSPDRAEDLRMLVDDLPWPVEVVDVDFDRAEAVFRFDPDQLFGKIDPDKILERFHQVIQHPSRHTFGVTPLGETPSDKLAKVEISIVGLDCKGCSFAAYDSVYRIPGVDRATASFRVGLLTAWIDPEQTNRAALEEALAKRGIEVPRPGPDEEKKP